ncbi:uncharacterized protein LOC126908704 isoform X2 [Daktulosphaira vitifoliae]|uniref:uncharacterized protein LOC126908704 isoform X2 n=1 Tax=Daktulosphaira vitifoliae TaxID=58002 RepID=UPI0021AA2E2B|nr:uncharacterized protein LOC126908704 isoform X2 [Daktulosphaira vitifoliae]
MYSLDGHDTSEMNVYEGDLNEDDRNDVRKCIVGDIIKIISGKIPLDGVVRGIKFFIFGSDEIPFAEYCCAAFYTYLVLDDSMFSGLILSTSAGVKLNKVINYLSSKNLPQAQNAFHNCIANLNINGFEQMNYVEKTNKNVTQPSAIHSAINVESTAKTLPKVIVPFAYGMSNSAALFPLSTRVIARNW